MCAVGIGVESEEACRVCAHGTTTTFSSSTKGVVE